jgi:hypothetical protein
MLFYRMILTRFFSMFAFLVLAACSASAVQPDPGELLTPEITAAPTDPLATFWLPTSTPGDAATQPPITTPGTGATPALVSTPLPNTVLTPQANPPASGATPGVPAGTGLSTDLPPVVALARTWLGGQLNLVDASIVLQNVERVEWPDTCLGVGQAGQGCAQVVTPGYRIIFYANGQSYEVRVDDTGRVLRLLEGGKG